MMPIWWNRRVPRGLCWGIIKTIDVTAREMNAYGKGPDNHGEIAYAHDGGHGP